MKLSTKTNRFPHTFSKARALECNYSVYVTRPCPASSAHHRILKIACNRSKVTRDTTKGQGSTAPSVQWVRSVAGAQVREERNKVLAALLGLRSVGVKRD